VNRTHTLLASEANNLAGDRRLREVSACGGARLRTTQRALSRLTAAAAVAADAFIFELYICSLHVHTLTHTQPSVSLSDPRCRRHRVPRYNNYTWFRRAAPPLLRPPSGAIMSTTGPRANFVDFYRIRLEIVSSVVRFYRASAC